MTEREIDDLLASWNSRLAAAAQNLVDLRAHPCYQRLLQASGLTGATAAAVTPVLDGMGTLFEHYDLVRRVVAQAEKARADLAGFFGVEPRRIQEIEFYLKGKSIRLAPVQIPDGLRTLLGPGENADLISAADLLSYVNQAFEAARNTVMAVDNAWNLLPRSAEDARQQIAQLRQGGFLLNELAAAESALQPLEGKLETDPLGAQQEMDSKVTPAIQRVHKLLDDMAREQTEIEQALHSAHAKLEDVLKSHAEAAATHAEAVLKLTDSPGVKEPPGDSSLEDLRGWVARLEQKFREGLRKPVLIGLQNWNKAADSLVSQCREALEANAAMLGQRSELRGRLDALKAKARALGLAENAALLEVSQQARDLLYARPTPLRRATDLVTQYESLLSRLKGTS